jgi:hypothetical protein
LSSRRRWCHRSDKASPGLSHRLDEFGVEQPSAYSLLVVLANQGTPAVAVKIYER